MTLLDDVDFNIDPADHQVHFKKHIVDLEMTVAQAAQFMEWVQMYCSFVRHAKMRKNSPVAEQDRKFPSWMYSKRAGLDTYRCKYHGHPYEPDLPLRNKPSQRVRCGALVTINFPDGYSHDYESDSRGKLNIRQFGDMEDVQITWH